MLSAEDNDLLTLTGPRTPGGEFMRRYWQPVALSEELPPDGAPLAARLLGEDLVLFRDDRGRPGLLGIHCAHRGADLSYGRIEDGGLRCLYHGWLYDIEGRCLEQPGEPAASRFHEKIRQTAYPCQEAGGLILAYMGPGQPPLLPNYEFLTVPEENRYVTKVFQECNYLQGVEAALDSQHHSFLHQVAVNTDDELSTRVIQANDASPVIEPQETAFGIRLYSVRKVPPDRQFVKVTNFVFPNFCAVTGDRDGHSVNWHVAIDDQHHWRYSLLFRRTAPVDKEAAARGRGEMTRDYRPMRNKSNRYLHDREEMRTSTYAGLGSVFTVHDTWVTEGQGVIADRTVERLGYNERGIMAMRKVLLRGIRAVQEGGEAPHVVRDRMLNRFPEIAARKEVIPASVDWHEWIEFRTLGRLPRLLAYALVLWERGRARLRAAS